MTGSSVGLIQHFTAKLHATFSLKRFGHLDYFLGLGIKHLLDSSIIMTPQSKYIRDLLHKTHLVEAHTISTPIWFLIANDLNMVQISLQILI